MRMLCSVKLSPHRYKTPQGYLYCKDAIIARTGPQTYLKSEIIEGSDSDEYIDVDRKPEEVFSEKTMASFEGAPLTIDHPSVSVGPDNYKDLSVGRVQNIRRGEYEGQPVMLADIIVNDAEAIELIESGEMVELSCGYDCDITGGDNPEQINIRGNHVALCEQGRAGIARIQDSKILIQNLLSKTDKRTGITLSKAIDDLKKFPEDSLLGDERAITKLMKAFDLEKRDVIRALNYKFDGLELTDSKKEKWGIKAIADGIGRGSLIQEFGKQGKQYKIQKINGNVIYAANLVTGDIVLFKKDEENVEWATITKSDIKDSIKDKKISWKEAVKSSYNHFVSDLGEKPSASQVLEDVVDNYDLDIDVEIDLDNPIKYNKWLTEVKQILNKEKLKFIADSREDTQDPTVGYYVNGQHFEHKDEKEAYKLARELQKKGELKEFCEYWVDEMGYGHEVDMRKQIRDSKQLKDYSCSERLKFLKAKKFKEGLSEEEEEEYWYCKGVVESEEAERDYLNNGSKLGRSPFEDSFEQFNIFVDNMTLEEAKEYCRVYGVRGKKKPDGFVLFGARSNLENLLNDFIGEEKRIHRILEEGWYSTPDFEEQMEKALRLDAAPKYAVFVKKDGKWVVFGGNESGKVDERAFLKKYEGVKVVENKDLDKVKAELNKEIKDEEPIIQEEPMTEEQAKEWAREYLETEWRNNSWEKPHPWGSAEFASKKLRRKINMEDAPIIPICKAIYKEVIDELLDKTQFHIKVDFANSFGRDGWYNYKDLESAHKAAVDYVRKCSHDGKSGRGEILIYSHEKDGSLLAASIAIDSKWSGKRYSNGYAIPVDSDEYDVRKRIDNMKYEEKLRPMLESIEPETPIKTGFKDAMPKHYIIALSGDKDESTWLGENDKPTDDFNKAIKFETYEEADSHRKTYCKGSIQEIRDSRIVDSKLKKEEVEVVKKLLEGIEYEEPIRYDDELKVIDIFFFKKPELRKAGRKLVGLYDIELTEEDDELSITLYDKFDKPRGIYLNEDSIKDKEEWTGFDLLRGPASKEFKNYLRDMGFYFEPSENGDYVHFEVKNADKWVKQRADDIRKHWAQFQDSYSKKFYVKAIKALEDKLQKLEKNELLDENQEDYEKQKNKMRKTIKKQIEEYKAKLEDE